jgi:hypothetical protein
VTLLAGLAWFFAGASVGFLGGLLVAASAMSERRK